MQLGSQRRYMCFLKELGKLDFAFQAILNRNLMKHVKNLQICKCQVTPLEPKVLLRAKLCYLEGIWLIWPTGVSVLHLSLFGSRFTTLEKKCDNSQALWPQNWILYGKNPERSKSMAVGSHSKTPSQPNPRSTLKFYRNNSNPVDVMIPFGCDDRCFFFFFPQHSEGLGVGDLIRRKPGIRLGGTTSLDVTSKESSRRHCLAFWGGVQFTHVTDSINFKQKEVVFASKKNFEKMKVLGATPLTNESAPNAKKTRKTGVSGGNPLLGSKVDVIFVIFATDQSLKLGGKCSSRKKNQCPFSINPLFNGWITPKDKTKITTVSVLPFNVFSYRLRQLHISRCPPLQQQPKP